MLLVAGCSSSVPAPHTPRVHGDTALDVEIHGVDAASGMALIAPAPARKVAPELAFDAVSDELDRICKSKEEPELSNLAMKERERAYLTCLQAESAKARAALIASAGKSDAKMKAIEAMESTYARYVDDVCWASEEVQWVDLEEGTRSDGTLRGYAWMACESRAEIEHSFLLRTLKLGDTSALAVHLEAIEPRARREAFFLKGFTDKARVLAAKPAPHAAAAPGIDSLGDAARSELVTRANAIASGATKLAQETCAVLDDRSGLESCEHDLSNAYLALGALEANGEDAGP